MENSIGKGKRVITPPRGSWISLCIYGLFSLLCMVFGFNINWIGCAFLCSFSHPQICKQSFTCCYEHVYLMALCAALFKYSIVYLAISVLLETDFLKTVWVMLHLVNLFRIDSWEWIGLKRTWMCSSCYQLLWYLSVNAYWSFFFLLIKLGFFF